MTVGWWVGVVYVKSCFLLLCFVHTQITFSWSLLFVTEPERDHSEVLLRVGLVLYSWTLAPPKSLRGPMTCADSGALLPGPWMRVIPSQLGGPET